MRKIILSLIVLAIAAPALTFQSGCRKADKRPKIALIMKSLANPFFKRMEDGAKTHQKEHDSEYVLIANGLKNETDIREQISLVEQMVAQGVDAIVLTPANSDALIAACKAAMKEGVIIINIDNKFDEKALAKERMPIPFYGPDNRAGARLAAEYLARHLKEGDEVIILKGIEGADNAEQRYQGFMDAINAAKLKKMAEETANWERSQAEKAVPGLVGKYPNVRAILCANDSMAIGAINGIAEENNRRKAENRPSILVVGFDNLEEAQKLILEGKLLCTIDQYPERIAAAGLDAALQQIQKKGTPAGGSTPVKLITIETLKKK